MRYAFAKAVCPWLPIVVSQRVRAIVFPLSEGRRLNENFRRKSITGSEFSGSTADYHSYRFAIHGFFEWRNIVMAQFFTSKHTSADIVEIGANVGTETVSYCDLVQGKGKVHAFEPLPSNIEELQSKFSAQTHLKLYPNAVSDKEVTVKFQIPPKESSGTGKIVSDESFSSNGYFEVDAAPLDKFIDAFNDVRFISIDTEGHEPFVLHGGVQTIERFRPAVVIEVSPKLLKRYANATNTDIFAFFEQRGYECFAIESFSLKPVDQTYLNLPNQRNWLCVPKEVSGRMPLLARELRKRMFIPWYLLPRLN